MRPRIKVIALAVDDVEGSLGFYRDGMGLPTQAIFGTESEDGSVVFFGMNNDMVLALYPRTALARDANVSAPSHGPAQLSVVLVHNVGSKREVDAIMEQAERAGAEITDPPHSGSGRARHRSFRSLLRRHISPVRIPPSNGGASCNPS